MKFLIHLPDGRKVEADSPDPETLRADMAEAGISSDRIEMVGPAASAFPATTSARAMGQEPGFREGLKDVATMPTRALGAMFDAAAENWPHAHGVIDPGYEHKSTASAFGEGMRSKPNAFLNDPSLTIGTIGSILAPEVGGPMIAARLGNYAKPLLSVLGGSVSGAGAYEAASQDPSLGRFGANVALGTALGGLGEGAKRFGMQSAKSSLLTGIKNKFPEGSEELVEQAMNERLIPFFGGYKGLSENAMSKVGKIADELESYALGDVSIDPLKAINNARISIDDMADNLDINPIKLKAAHETIDRIEEHLMRPHSIVKKKFAPEDQYFRFTNKQNPMSDFGHAMFAKNRDAVSGVYGKNEFTVKGNDLVDVNDLKSAIKEAWENRDLSRSMNATDAKYYDQLTANDIIDELTNIDDIVNSAKGYDDKSLTQWFYDAVVEPKGIKGIKTSDGAVVFDESIINDVSRYGNTEPVLESMEIALKDARKLRSMLADMAAYEKGVNKIAGQNEASREVMRQVLSAENEASPIWRLKTSEMAPYMRISKIADAQILRGDTRQPLGMRNALGGIMGGGILGGATQSPGVAALGMLLGAGAGNIQNTIGGGRAMWELGNLLQRSAGVGQAAPRALGIYKDER